MTTTIPKTTSELAQHARDLGAAFGVRVIEPGNLAPHAGGAAPRSVTLEAFKGLVDPAEVTDAIIVHPVIDESTYVVQLHEFGHLVHPTGHIPEVQWPPRSIRDVNLKLLEESSAWKWARRHALDWTPLMRRVMMLSWSSYVKTAARYGVVVRKGGPLAYGE